jgi:hypothetical protein
MKSASVTKQTDRVIREAIAQSYINSVIFSLFLKMLTYDMMYQPGVN